jgi:hypothetical protein
MMDGRCAQERRLASGRPRHPAQTPAQTLHSLGADVDALANDRTTPVYAAAQNGHVRVVRIQRSLGADMNVPANDGTASVRVAALLGHEAVVRLLGMNRPSGLAPLMFAAGYGHESVLVTPRTLGRQVPDFLAVLLRHASNCGRRGRRAMDQPHRAGHWSQDVRPAFGKPSMPALVRRSRSPSAIDRTFSIF